MRAHWLLKIGIVLVLLGTLGCGGFAAWVYGEFTRPGPLEQEMTVVVPPGGGVKSIANILAANGIVRSAQIFELGARAMDMVGDVAGRLRAGEFAFPARISARDAAKLLQAGKTVQRRLTLAEGLSSSQIVAQLNATNGLDGFVMIIPSEGSLLPETYYFSHGDSRAAIIERMQQGMRDALGELWSDRQSGLPLKSPEQAVILASIVEKETGLAAERARVAGVFINRLRRGMRLQSDPTVAYGLTENGEALGRPLSKADLKTPTPYNTYVIAGLPPGPIANPGRDSLQAVLHPDVTQDLYFVADGSGGHAFARTLDEHNKNVRRWRKLQAEQDGGS